MRKLALPAILLATSCNAPLQTDDQAEGRLGLSTTADSQGRFESFENVIAGQARTIAWKTPLAATVVSEKPISATDADKYANIDLNANAAITPVIGAYGDGNAAIQFKLLMYPQFGPAEPPPVDRLTVGDARASPTPKVSPRTLAEIANSSPDIALPVTIRLDEELTSSLIPALPVDNWVRFQDDALSNEEIWVLKDALIAARVAEARTKQQRLHQWLIDHAVDGASGYWLVNAMTASLTPQQIHDVAALGYVRWVSYADPTPLPPTSNKWDGTYVRSIGHMNASAYLNAGFHGGISNSYNGNGRVRVAVMDDFFDATSPAWRDGVTTASRVIETWSCSSTTPELAC